MGYRVKIESFEGPFELLLSLVTQQKVKIGSISVSEIADQFRDVCVKDAEGRVVPNAKVPVTFSLEGPGEIVATDNGDETDFADFHQPTRRTFNGWAQALVRPLPNQTGTIRLTVKSEGLSSSSVIVKATQP